MSAPKTKSELQREMAAGRQEWEDLLAQVDDRMLRTPNVDGIWSIKDVLAHVCAYEQYMAAMLEDIRQNSGNATAMLDSYYQMQLTLYRKEHPELPEHLQSIKGEQVNDVFVAAYRYKTPAEVRAMESEAYQGLAQWVEEFTEEELQRPFTNTGRALIEVLPRQCYQHYEQHIPTIRDWLEEQARQA